MKKANDFYEIQDAVEFNSPIDDKDEFYTDFSGFRKGFSESKIYKFLNIDKEHNCNKLSQPKKVFLSGHRGTGKTTELLKLKNAIDKTKCYLTIFCDLSNEELDVNNIDFVDVIILILEKLIETLKAKEIDIPKANIESFYNWYEQRITEINKETDQSATIEIEAKAGFDIFSFLSIVTKTKGKLSGSNKTKETIRSTFINKFSDFSLKFNQFILDIKEYLNTKALYKDLLFIVDGFEKIGSLEDRRKILIENSNKFIEIKTNMIITLPIELFSEASKLNEFAKSISFPLINLDENAKDRFREFIYKRVDKSLFKDESIVDKIIEYGAGSPRETLKVILNAFYEAQEDILDMQSVKDAQEVLSESIVNYLLEDEVELIKTINSGKKTLFSDLLANLLVKKIVLEYDNGKDKRINPILLDNDDFKELLESE